MTALYGLASELARVIPPGSRVFHLGGPLGLYIAGLEPYLRQERDVATLALLPDQARLTKSGFWGKKEIEWWLERDSDYAVIVPARVALYPRPRLYEDLALIESLLAIHFTRVAVLDRYPGSLYYVYRRTH